MRYLTLLKAGLWRKPLRTILTGAAIAVSFVLFGVMHGVIAGMDGALDKMSDTRLRVMSRASFLEPLPLAHGARIAHVDGVATVAHATIFAGYAGEVYNSVSSIAISDAFFDTIPELHVPPAQREALRTTRTGALVGKQLALKHGWDIGDRVPLKSFLFALEDGGEAWQFDVVGFVNAGPDDDEMFANEMYFNYAYLDEARAGQKGTVHQFLVRIDDADRAVQIGAAVDALFANSSDETSTMNEKQFARSQLARVGNIKAFIAGVLGAVMFTLLFLTGTTMTQSVRERVSEFGVLKALGFTDATVFTLVVVEALVICLLAAALGLAVSAGVFPSVFSAMGLAGAQLPAEVWATGLGIATLLAVGVAAWPGWRARQLSIVAAISGRT